MEATIGGLPAVAVSLDVPANHPGGINYKPAANVTRRVVEMVLKYTLPSNVLLSVNVPFLLENEIRGYRVTRLGLRVYNDILIRHDDHKGPPSYSIGGDPPTGIPEEDTDVGALTDGYISITPIQLDLTAHHLLDTIQNWDWPPDV